MKKITFLLGIAVCCTGCYYDVEEELYPNAATPCDTTGITYASRVQPLLQSSCYSCHNVSNPQGNVVLEGYANTLVYANNGKLVGAISHEAGYAPMPQGSNKLGRCDIESVKLWISRGAPDN